MKTAFRHPKPSLQSLWNYAQLGLLVFPLTPFFGAVGIVLASLGTWLAQYRTIIRRPLNWGFALLSVLLIITASFAYDKTAAFLGLFNFLPYFIVFAGFSALIQTPAQLRQISWILVFSSLPVVIFGFGQLFLEWSFKIRILWFVVEWEIEPGGQPIGRMASIFMYANILAGYLMIVFILGLGLWVENYRRIRGQINSKFKIRLEKFALLGNQRQSPRLGNPPAVQAPPGTPVRTTGRTVCPGGKPSSQLSSGTPRSSPLRKPSLRLLSASDWLNFSQNSKLGVSPSSPSLPPSLTPSSPSSSSPYLTLLFLSVAVIANFVALILTDSRNAWAIAIFACLAYALYEGWRILVAGVAGIATSVLLAAFAPSPVAQLFRKVVPAFFWARLNDQMYPDRPVALLRKTQWQFALSLTGQRPWTGWGLRNFTLLYQAKMDVWLGHPHNLFLMVFAETGFPTALLFCGLLVWIFIAGVQLLRKSQHIEEAEDKLIFFSYLLVFVCWVLFNTADVTLFDFRLNTLSWLLFSAISGVAYRYNQYERLQVR